MNRSTIVRITALLGALSVGLGAFAAHSLRELVSQPQLLTFETGVRYQFYHTFAVGLAAVLYRMYGIEPARLRLAVWLWIVGIVLFSGSLFLLSLREVHGLPVAFLGPVTPIGGLLLIGGWMALFTSTFSRTA
ncbi:uncharacterized membrane protein YgdD (TMEM256/DUF423 family) [Lewinella aquimaris]|uniref:Uncharacterized membrane protein YgdD (TMEM256/DUF423 family) n=1 Tax=Neolewinella aquimaris TaxID=1835722 RepID=A0A840DXZ5_9BACT|nr:DUF423 domain-containing protein [Neolewinella aquimaris]MBB4078094.1 uncharacterized membrane protein YgdD (TMEM256/DUF423 family) [Neolewinella aquimaris]